MKFESYFRGASYATVLTAALALLVAGGVGLWLGLAFVVGTAVAWKLEGSRWQLSEKVALLVILASLPLFYLDWRVLTPYLQTQYLETGQRGHADITVLAHLILFLSIIKLLQLKADRDWFFLYLISFFEVLLAAALTASPIFVLTLILYLLCALTTVVAFEIHKARRKVVATQTRLLVPPDPALFRKLPMRLWRRRYLETRRLPLVSAGLLILIVVLALPFFLIAPRTASSALKRGGNGVSGFIGFSDNVTLGQIGRLKANDEVFMRVRVESAPAIPTNGLRWRGVGLDEFTGKGWKRSFSAGRSEKKESESGFFKLGTTEDVSRLTTQTFFVEPVDTPVVFGAARIVAVQGKLPFVRVDSEMSVQTRLHDQERMVYRIFSDTTEPGVNVLRADRLQYLVESARYLELPPNLDPRISALAGSVVRRAESRNPYDSARAIESYLRDSYQYTLELKAGGPDPLADFLFNVREGHCEYFATAMAVMLRTQGIASRVVNGFLPGEFNEAAGAFTVRQSDAHSWVEVYFPQANSWVTFDPTPPAGRAPRVSTGLAAQLAKYSEALELMWFQYVVGYDKQEQRSLMTSLRKQLLDFRRDSSVRLEGMRAAFPSYLKPILGAVAFLGVLVLIVILTRRVHKFGWRRGLKVWQSGAQAEPVPVEFYQRLLKLLEKQGLKREVYQTPLEFAVSVGVAEARMITAAYNRVRFGGQALSPVESRALNDALVRLERGLPR
jgi:transglutaminase-like putative cysteine protease